MTETNEQSRYRPSERMVAAGCGAVAALAIALGGFALGRATSDDDHDFHEFGMMPAAGGPGLPQGGAPPQGMPPGMPGGGGSFGPPEGGPGYGPPEGGSGYGPPEGNPAAPPSDEDKP